MLFKSLTHTHTHTHTHTPHHPRWYPSAHSSCHQWHNDPHMQWPSLVTISDSAYCCAGVATCRDWCRDANWNHSNLMHHIGDYCLYYHCCLDWMYLLLMIARLAMLSPLLFAFFVLKLLNTFMKWMKCVYVDWGGVAVRDKIIGSTIRHSLCVGANRMRLCVCVCVWVCMRVWVCVYVCMYVYVFIQMFALIKL
jgi:hypothetical protein